MQTSEVQRYLDGYPLPLGFVFKIDEPYFGYWKLHNAWACTDTANKIIYFNKKVLKYLDLFCIETIIKHELGHAFVGVSDSDNCHKKDWYTFAHKCGLRLEDEYEVSRRYNMRKNRKKLGYSFKDFLVLRKRDEKYYIPKNYKKSR